VARALNGVVHGAWINADGTVSVLSPGIGAPKLFGSAALPAGVLTLIGTDAYQPAVVFSGKTNGRLPRDRPAESNRHGRSARRRPAAI